MIFIVTQSEDFLKNNFLNRSIDFDNSIDYSDVLPTLYKVFRFIIFRVLLCMYVFNY